jgi:two-component system, LytTR family, response regulator
MKAIIIDDEAGCRDALESLLKKYCPYVSSITKAVNADSGYEAIIANKPDIVFLDIEMPGGSGFDLLERLGEVNFDVIFTTAYGHFAIKAIKFSAVDYLLKPIDPDELVKAVEKTAQKKFSQSLINQKFQALLENLHPAAKSKKVAVPDAGGFTFVNVADIVRCESDGNYTTIILAGGAKMVASKTLGDFEELFTGEKFFRVHRSHLINMEKIKKYIKGEGGYVVMEDNSQVEVSRRKKLEFLEFLGQV